MFIDILRNFRMQARFFLSVRQIEHDMFLQVKKQMKVLKRNVGISSERIEMRIFKKIKYGIK